MGVLLELGSKGNLESNNLVRVCGNGPPTIGSGLAGQASRTAFDFWIRIGPLHIPRGERSNRRTPHVSKVRGVLSVPGEYDV